METLIPEIVTWSLASDQKLLDALQSLSLQFADRSQACIAKVNELSLDVTTSEVSLRNTFNEFLMLGNLQFIENRVYDDDGEEDEDTTISTVSDMDPMMLMRDGFQAGLSALSLFHTDTDTANKMVDFYDRPVPFVIGTDCFNNSQSCGLGEEDFIEQEAPETEFGPFHDHSKEVEERIHDGRENIYENFENQDDFVDDGDGEERISRLSRGEGHTLLSQSQEVDAGVLNVPKSSGNPLKDMLNAQIRNRGSVSEPVSSGHISDVDYSHSFSATPSSMPTSSQANISEENEEEESGDLFATQDDPYSLFGTSKTTTNKFNSKIERDSLADLFGSSLSAQDDNRDRSASVDSLFGGNSGNTFSSRTLSRDVSNGVKRNSMFGTDDEKLFDEVNTNNKVSAPKIISIILPKTAASDTKNSVFDEDDTSDGVSSFSPKAITADINNNTPQNGIRGLGATDLFGEGLFGKSGGVSGEEDDDLFSQARINDLGKNKIAVAASAKFSSLFGDDDDDDDSSSLFGKKPITTQPLSSASISNVAAKIVPSKSFLLDDDNENDDLFGNRKSSNKPFFATIAADNGENGLNPPAKATTVAARPAVLGKSNSIFDDDDDDVDSMLFSSAKSKPIASSVTAPTTVLSVSAAVPAKKSSMFDDEDDNNIIIATSVTNSNNANASTVPVVKPIIPLPLPVKKKSSVFDSDSDDDLRVTMMQKGIQKVSASAQAQTAIGSPAPPVVDRVFDAEEKKPLVTTESVLMSNGLVGAMNLPLPVPAPLACRAAQNNDSEIESDKSGDNLIKSTVPVKSAADSGNSQHKIEEPHDPLFTANALSASEKVDFVVEEKKDDETSLAVLVTSMSSGTKASDGIASHIRGLDPSKIVIMLPGQTRPTSAVSSKANLFGDEDDDNFLSKSVTNTNVSGRGSLSNANLSRATVTKNSRKTPTKKKTLFDDDNDDDRGLFSSSFSNNNGVSSTVSSTTKAKSLFDDDVDNFLKPLVKADAHVQVPVSTGIVSTSAPLASTVSIESINSIVFQAPTKKDDKEDLFSSKTFSEPLKNVNSSAIAPAAIVSETVKRSSMFGDDSDDESLFGRPVSMKSSVAGVHIVNASGSKFFAPDPLVIAETAPKKTVFGDLESTNDLFSNNRSSAKIAPSVVPTNDPDTSDIPLLSGSKKVVTSSLFGEDHDDEDLLFAPKSSSATAPKSLSASTSAPVSISSNPSVKRVFDDDDNDDPLVGTKTTSMARVRSMSPIASSTSSNLKKSSLFGDDDDPLSFSKKTTASSSKGKSLFDDDD